MFGAILISVLTSPGLAAEIPPHLNDQVYSVAAAVSMAAFWNQNGSPDYARASLDEKLEWLTECLVATPAADELIATGGLYDVLTERAFDSFRKTHLETAPNLKASLIAELNASAERLIKRDATRRDLKQKALMGTVLLGGGAASYVSVTTESNLFLPAFGLTVAGLIYSAAKRIASHPAERLWRSCQRSLTGTQLSLPFTFGMSAK